MSEAKPELTNSGTSKEPAQFPVRPATNTPGPTTNAGLSELSHLARQAFEEKRRKQCMALTSAILKIDPEYKEALVIQSWVRSDLDRDLESARRWVEEARIQNDRELYSRAEIMARRILNVDPGIEDARDLLLHIVSQRPVTSASEPDDQTVKLDAYPGLPTIRRTRSRMQTVVLIVLLAIVTSVGAFQFLDRGKTEYNGAPDATAAPQDGIGSAGNVSQNSVPSTSGLFRLTVSPATGVQMMLDEGPVVPVRPEVEVQPGSHRLYFWAPGYMPELMSADVAAGERRNLTVVLKPNAAKATAGPAPRSPVQPAEGARPAPNGTTSATAQSARNAARTPSPANTPSAATPEPPGAARVPSTPAAPIQASLGMLALSSPIPIDIYMGEQLLGTTPITLNLPAGNQTLEYHYRNLRKTVSHEIRSNETATAAISFDVSVQINARPWAQVFVEGIQARPLGQTPLSNVLVPAGSVLSFRHPNFPEKKYRVSGDESAIQVVFP